MTDLLLILLVAASVGLLTLYWRRETARIDREFEQRKAALELKHRRSTDALHRYGVAFAQWERGTGSYEQVEAAYDDYVRTSFGDEDVQL